MLSARIMQQPMQARVLTRKRTSLEQSKYGGRGKMEEDIGIEVNGEKVGGGL